MSATPLLDRIKERRPRPQPLIERMGPFARRLAQKQLAPKDTTLYVDGQYVPAGSDGGA